MVDKEQIYSQLIDIWQAMDELPAIYKEILDRTLTVMERTEGWS